MSIQTDSTPLEDPKDPDTCHVFALYKTVATDQEQEEMRTNYQKGGYGYGHAKTALFQKLLAEFEHERARFDYYMNNLEEVDKALKHGAERARKTAQMVMKRVREKLGYGA
jgi:tryptophanyl-tRNA synthetase